MNKTKKATNLTAEQLKEDEVWGHHYDHIKKRYVCKACGKWSRDELTIVKHQDSQK